MAIPPKRDSEIEKAILKLLTDFGELHRSAVVEAISKKFSGPNANEAGNQALSRIINQIIARLVQTKRIVEFKDLLRPKP